MSATAVKTIVATGASSGLGFELVRQLLAQPSPYRFILGARDTARTQAAYDAIKFDTSNHSLTILPLELADLKTVKSFAQATLEKLGQGGKIDYLMLNAAISSGAELGGLNGSKWCQSYIVNHLSQHYLIHLLRDRLVASHSRIVVVSSGAVRMVTDPSVLENEVKTGSGADAFKIYPDTKFIQLLGAHWWRRQLAGSCTVVAVSPGLIPNTGLGRGMNSSEAAKFVVDMKDAKSVPEGASFIFRAFTRDDFPDDPDQIFLTSWGEWWPKDVYAPSLDKKLQDKWCPSRKQIEEEEGLSA